MKKLIPYIIDFLIGGSEHARWSAKVGYTDDASLFHKYLVVIKPSTFFNEFVFDTKESLPQLPLQEIEGTPLLFGEPIVRKEGATLVIEADIIASAFFLLTRYEETQRRDVRDKHGRFPGKESLPYKAGFIHRPIVDEYGVLLRKWLRSMGASLPELPPSFKKIYLTHDVDALCFCRSIRQLLRESIKGVGLKKALSFYLGPIASDPFFTFPWLIRQDKALIDTNERRCEAIYFLKSGGKGRFDRPRYSLKSRAMRVLFTLLKQNNIQTGLHSSYYAGEYPDKIKREKRQLEKIIDQPISINRHHFLSLREPEDYDWLESAGIGHDFTMGYADVSGFRLGTCRPVHWINPITKQVSNIMIHPLTVMDVTLSDASYMNMSLEEAYNHCISLFEQVRAHSGELILLWHNDTVAQSHYPVSVDWHSLLYESLLNYLKSA